MTVRSPWDGSDRAPLRRLLAAVVAFDVVVVAIFVSTRAPSPLAHPLAPRWLLALGGRPAPVIVIAALAIAAAARFGSRPGSRFAGLALLALAGVLNEALGALYEGPMRAFFSSGAALAGWVAGLFYAARLGARDPRRSEAIAEIGACAGLAATYVGAVSSKLVTTGLSWADAGNLQGMIVSQQRFDRPLVLIHYSDLVVGSRPLAATLAALTLVAQASMLFYPWSPRGRALAGIAVLGFHLNVALLTPIVFLSPMVLLAALSFPWPRLWARARGREAPAAAESDVPSVEVPPDRARRAAAEGLIVAVIAALAAWLSPLKAYTRLHHDGRHHLDAGAERADPLPGDISALLDGLQIGDPVASLAVARFKIQDRKLTLDLTSAAGASMRVTIARAGVLGFDPPRSTTRYEIFYESVSGLDDVARDRALDAVQQRILRAERSAPAPAGL